MALPAHPRMNKIGMFNAFEYLLRRSVPQTARPYCLAVAKALFCGWKMASVVVFKAKLNNRR